jgi:cytochrome c553
MKRIIAKISAATAMLLLVCGMQTTVFSRENNLSNASSSFLVWNAVTNHVKTEKMGPQATFVFWVTNAASTNVSILRTETSCDCTVPQLPSLPWVLKPGESGPLVARLNTTGKFGFVTNYLGVVTHHGMQILTLIAEIPLTPAPFNTSARARERKIAEGDRQAVFSNNSCAACHALPAWGKTGEPLYNLACGICHNSEKRAADVPDLGKTTNAPTANYWRTWVTHGRAGSLMPAFAKSEGGILETNQVDSLVEFLLKKYPAAK